MATFSPSSALTTVQSDSEHHEGGVMVTFYRSGYQPMTVFLPSRDLDWSDPAVYRADVPEILALIPEAIEELVRVRGPQPRSDDAKS